MPSASASVVVANDVRYMYRVVADRDFHWSQRDISLWQSLVFRMGVINFCSALHFAVERIKVPTISCKIIYLLQSNVEFAGYIAVALGHNVPIIFA